MLLRAVGISLNSHCMDYGMENWSKENGLEEENLQMSLGVLMLEYYAAIKKSYMLMFNLTHSQRKAN